ncbi:hypothetical protein [Bradyrhizobium sp. Ash2021]|uniref:hypothetical protein n=1 Tax=Bradyrhizobium sp. Ash2021 TaxID=2954771 RepID=UPI002814D757|nr:hypothetical protein [Bradyrhizobium sp. Ash2021]WMT79352.1 hypothetical protein NL528_23980 [Bradyrhizobium sp. Ash2021]
MPEAELPKVEGANKALDHSHRIVRSNIVLNPGRKETGLLSALAGLEWAIRHEPNGTSTPKKAEFLLSLDGHVSAFRRRTFGQILAEGLPGTSSFLIWVNALRLYS